MKCLGLDVGDKWTGVAISDPLGIIATPFDTIETKDLENRLKEIIAQESITTIVVGYPKTMRGTESDQTKKIVSYADELKEKFPTILLVMQDERLTSKHAAKMKRPKTKEDKKKVHAVAAALILKAYLDYQYSMK